MSIFLKLGKLLKRLTNHLLLHLQVLPKGQGFYAILITDIAPNEENVPRLQALFEKGLTVVLLDYHDTNKWIAEQHAEFAFIESELEGKMTCGSELLYLYLKEKGLFAENVAKSPYLANFVEQVRSYDTWDWDRTGNVFAKQLNSILYTVGTSKFMEMQMEKLTSHMDDETATQFTFNELEMILVEVEDKKESKYIKGRAKQIFKHIWTIGDNKYNVGVVFGDQNHSTLGNELNKQFPELDFIAILDLNSGKGSLRTIHGHVHVGEIAKAIADGAGHPKAAGFEYNNETQLFKIEESLGVIQLDIWHPIAISI